MLQMAHAGAVAENAA